MTQPNPSCCPSKYMYRYKFTNFGVKRTPTGPWPCRITERCTQKCNWSASPVPPSTCCTGPSPCCLPFGVPRDPNCEPCKYIFN